MAGEDEKQGEASAQPDFEAMLKRALGPIVAQVQKLQQQQAASSDPEAVNKAVAAQLEKLVSTEPTPTDKSGSRAAGNSAGGKDKAMEDMQAKFGMLEKKLHDQEKATHAAQAETKNARQRAEVQSRLQAKLGADSPHVELLMDSLFDVKKRFGEDSNGALGVKFKGEYGEEVVSLDEGINRMFQNELKPLVSQSKAQHLPAVGGGRGNPFTSSMPQGVQPQGQQAGNRQNPFAAVLGQYYASNGEHDIANSLVQSIESKQNPVK